METGSPCLNIILLEVTMRALVCPSPLDLITNSPNRAISSRSTSRIVWREGKEREAGEKEEEEWIAGRDSYCQINLAMVAPRAVFAFPEPRFLSSSCSLVLARRVLRDETIPSNYSRRVETPGRLEYSRRTR